MRNKIVYQSHQLWLGHCMTVVIGLVIIDHIHRLHLPIISYLTYFLDMNTAHNDALVLLDQAQ